MNNSIQFKKFTGNDIDEQINSFLELYSDCNIKLSDVQYQQSSVRKNKQVTEYVSRGYSNVESYVYKLVDEVEYSALVSYLVNIDLKNKKDKRIKRENELLNLGVDSTVNLLNTYLKGEMSESTKWEGIFLHKNLKKSIYYGHIVNSYKFNYKTDQYEFNWTRG